MPKDIITVPATITKIETKVDRSIKITALTQEIPPQEASVLFGLANKMGYMGFSERQIQETDFMDLPEIKTEDKKTPSQRLRDRMFVYYKETKGKKDGFDTWYKETLDKLGEKYLAALN